MAPECVKHSEIDNRVKRNAKDIDKIYELLEKVRNRLPHGATAIISISFMVIGWLIAWSIKK